MSMKSETTHLQKNGYFDTGACGRRGDLVRTWNLCAVTCKDCKKSKQFSDSQAYGDLGSEGREISWGPGAKGMETG